MLNIFFGGGGKCPSDFLQVKTIINLSNPFYVIRGGRGSSLLPSPNT